MNYIRIFQIAVASVLIGTGIFLYTTSEAPAEKTKVKIQSQANIDSTKDDSEKNKSFEVSKSKEEWRAELTRDEFRILRQKGTEMPYVNKYYKTDKEGIYVCAACGNKLFSSKTKYNSGSGWPAFYAPINQDAIVTKKDKGMFVTRTEILCSRCGSHLGHVFEDGPEPTGLRYCINSVAMDLIEKNKD